jgi:hypothetical protein
VKYQNSNFKDRNEYLGFILIKFYFHFLRICLHLLFFVSSELGWRHRLGAWQICGVLKKKDFDELVKY